MKITLNLDWVYIMKHLTIWGSLASIIALGYSLSSIADSTTLTVNGSNNAVVGQNHGDININNYSSKDARSESDGLILRNMQAGLSLVMSYPSIASATDKSKHVCSAVSGTPIQLTGRSHSEGYLEFKEIKILKGECKEKTGWVNNRLIAFK